MHSANSRLTKLLTRLQLHLAQANALPALALLGVFAGLMTSGTILLFRYAIEGPLSALLPGQHHEAFESLDPLIRLVMPFIGSLVLLLVFSRLGAQTRTVGISHVLERIKKHQGYMPIHNFLAQFIGGVVCALSGQSTGREGPAVHLGAATGSILGRKLSLPTQHVHLLLACGVAAAISASFNTPIAGVIFAMEVIIAGFSLSSFIPVILASVTGALITRAVYGHEPAFTVPPLEMRSLLELPFLIVEGLLFGALAALFIWICAQTAQKAPNSLAARLLLIGVANGILAMFIPQMMGIGYDTVNDALFGHISVTLLFTLAIAKLLITGLNLGLGQPGGAIGPMLFIGACAGGAFGELINWFAPDQSGATGYYAMLGMAAMMAACLQAPLTGLLTLLELTSNPNIILPAMLVVVIANLTASEVFKQKALFPRLLQLRGLTLNTSPVELMLRQGSILSVTERNFKIIPKYVSALHLKDILSEQPKFIVIEDESHGVIATLPAADVASLLMDDDQLQHWQQTIDEEDLINLMAIPGKRQATKPLFVRANLQQALDKMECEQIEMLSIHYGNTNEATSLIGVVEQEKIHNYYRY